MSGRRLVLPAVATGISLVLLIGLGAWQWRRMAEKTALIATIQQRIGTAPVAFPARAEWPRLDLANWAYRPVALAGRFDHAREAHVFFSLSKPVGGVSGPGYLIVTPFHLAEGGTVLVNRGFVPEARKAPATRTAGQGDSTETLTGLVRLPEQRSMFSAAEDRTKNIHFVRDPLALAAALGLGEVAPVMVDLRTPAPGGGLPVPGVTQVDIPNNHRQYAFTWWSLAAVLAVIFAVFARGMRQPSSAPDRQV